MWGSYILCVYYTCINHAWSRYEHLIPTKSLTGILARIGNILVHVNTLTVPVAAVWVHSITYRCLLLGIYKSCLSVYRLRDRQGTELRGHTKRIIGTRNICSSRKKTIQINKQNNNTMIYDGCLLGNIYI